MCGRLHNRLIMFSECSGSIGGSTDLSNLISQLHFSIYTLNEYILGYYVSVKILYWIVFMQIDTGRDDSREVSWAKSDY